MGTAGPLALARDILDDGSGDPFFVLNRCEPAHGCPACAVSCGQDAFAMQHGARSAGWVGHSGGYAVCDRSG